MNITPMGLHDADRTYGENQKEWEKRIGHAIDELENDPDVHHHEN